MNIAQATRSKIGPIVGGIATGIARTTKTTVDPLTGKTTDLARATRSRIGPLARRLPPAVERAAKYKISPLAGGLALSMALGGVGLSAAVYSPASAAPVVDTRAAAATSPALTDAADRTAARDVASRSRDRRTATPRSGPVKPRPHGTPADPPAGAHRTAKPSAPAPSPTRIAPVGGLSQSEMDNAIAIVRAGQQMNLPRRAFVIAIATALQESHLRNLANPNVPGSLGHPNEGVGHDYDSVGLFQQRPNWGTVDQLMDPQEAARRFYRALVAISGWEQLDVTVAAQRVQVSAFPDAYAKWQGLAEQIVDAIL